MLLLYNRKDISGGQHIEEYFSDVVATHVLVLSKLWLFSPLGMHLHMLWTNGYREKWEYLIAAIRLKSMVHITSLIIKLLWIFPF